MSDADSGPVELAALSLEYHAGNPVIRATESGSIAVVGEAGNPVVIYTANQIMKSAKAFGH